MPLQTADDNFIALVHARHGLELTVEDLDALYLDHFEADQRRTRQAFYGPADPSYEVCTYEVQNGKIGKIVMATAMGFFSGGGWIGAAIGFVGALINTLNQPSENSNKDEDRGDTKYGFRNGGKLATQGAPIPLVYTNRDIDPDAGNGVQVSGVSIHTRVDTLGGSNILYQLQAIGAGESAVRGWGQYGFVDQDSLLINEQPRTNFSALELQTQLRLGTRAQTAILPEFPYYSQVISPSTYNVFGIDYRGQVKSSNTVPNPDAAETNVTVVGNRITKVGLLPGWDAGVFGTEGLNGDGNLIITPQGPVTDARAAGLSAIDIDFDPNSILFGIIFFNSTYYVVESGNIRTAATPLIPGDTFEVRVVSGSTQVTYHRNGAIFYTSTVVPTLPLYPDVSLFNPGATLDVNLNGFGVVQDNVDQTLISIQEADKVFDLFNVGAQDFTVQVTGDTLVDQKFLVASRDTANQTFNTTPALNLVGKDELFAFWTAKYETTKHVDEIHLNLAFQLTSREGDNDSGDFGETKNHGSLFDLRIRTANDPVGSEVLVQRFLVVGKRPSTLRRHIDILNLPLGRYYIELRPLTKNPQTPGQSIYQLTDDGTNITIDPGITINGGAIAIRSEMYQIAAGDLATDANTGDITKWIGYNDKDGISSEQGPTGSIVSVNEVVNPGSIRNPANGLPNAYPGLALLGIRLLASERVQQAPAFKVLVTRGRVCPNVMAAGEQSALGNSTTMVDPAATFLSQADPVRVGWRIRNLTRKVEAQITEVTQTSIRTIEELGWQECDRYMVYFLDSTAFFPDIFADTVANDYGGIWTFMDPDEDLDYPSIVESRQFVKAQKLYCNMLIEAPIPWVQWATQGMVGSMLLPFRRNGRYGLRPDRMDPISNVFNATDIANFRLDYLDWQSSVANKLVCTYLDGRSLLREDGERFRPKSVVISTPAAYLDAEPVVEETLNLETITNPDQVERVGRTYLNSIRSQNRNVSFDTSYQAIGVYAGDLISVQHPLARTSEEISGRVVRLFEFDAAAGTQAICMDCEPLLMEGCFTARQVGAISLGDSADAIAANVMVGDLVRNQATRQIAFITAVTSETITAAITLEAGHPWQVLNLTPPVDSYAWVRYANDGSTRENLTYEFFQFEDLVCVRLRGLSKALELDDVINIGGRKNIYRVQSVSPNGRNIFSIVATYHPGAELYERGDLVVQYDDEIFNAP
jgi:hypothetical protein